MSERVRTQPCRESANQIDKTSSLGNPDTQDQLAPPSIVVSNPPGLNPETPPAPRVRPIQPCCGSTKNGSPKKPPHPGAIHHPVVAVSWMVSSRPLVTLKRPYLLQRLAVQ